MAFEKSFKSIYRYVLKMERGLHTTFENLNEIQKLDEHPG